MSENLSLIGIQISRFRKAAGLTQEELGEAVGISGQAVSRWECGGAPDVTLLPVIADKLGVTIDALFGRDGSERVDVEDVVGRYLCSFPAKERLDKLCRLVWASVKHQLDDGLGIPEMGYLETCLPDMGDGRSRLMLSQLRTAGGILLDIHAEDLSFVTLWPEPKDGYAAWLAPKSEYRCLFELLARPGCLELLEYLHCRKRSYFVAQAAAKQLKMPCKEVEELLKGLEERQILRSMELEMEGGEVRAYELAEPAAFVPFLYIARCFMQTGMNYICVGNYDTPLLQKEKWKEEYSSRNAVQNGANYIHFGSYDNSCLQEEKNDPREEKMNSTNMSCYLKKFWKENTLAIFFLVILCGLQVGANLLMMQSFQGIIDRNMSQFIFWMLFLVIIWFLIYGLTGIETFFRCRAIRVMNNAIRQDIAEMLLTKSYRSFHEQPVGEYLSQFTNDISQIENLAWNPFFDFIRSTVTVVFSIAALLMLHWSLLAASLVTTVIMLSFPKLFHQQMEHLGSVCTREQSAAVSRLKELLAGYNVLRFFNQEQRFINEAELAGDQIEKPKFRMAYVKGFANAGLGCVNIVCQMLHVALIGILSVRGIILQGALTGGGNLCGILSAGLGSMVQDVLSMSSVKPYFEKISVHVRESVEDQRETEASNAGMQMEIMQNEITIDDVSFCYDKKTVFRGFTARFKKGGKYTLTGPSGCGKSTLLKLMLGCLPEYTGSIRLDDRELRGCRPEQLWHQISYIEQDVFLFNSTIRDNITLGREFTTEQVRKALQDSALENDLLSMPDGLDTIVGENGDSLSGGQKQRVAIARALLYNRSILLVDEGTSALDRENADRIEKNLLSKPELTLILVSHHLSEEQKKQFTRVFTLSGAS